jgi:hypothetical protein
MGIGQFISPRVYETVNGWIGLGGPRASWIIAAVCFVGAFLVSLLKTVLKKTPRIPLISQVQNQ